MPQAVKLNKTQLYNQDCLMGPALTVGKTCCLGAFLLIKIELTSDYLTSWRQFSVIVIIILSFQLQIGSRKPCKTPVLVLHQPPACREKKNEKRVRRQLKVWGGMYVTAKIKCIDVYHIFSQKKQLKHWPLGSLIRTSTFSFTATLNGRFFVSFVS